ncbi:hypothetical protein L1887_57827 [Cichorium endivia]|nr:hypothetical protein L1887_57827 [Cichorium endivia]
MEQLTHDTIDLDILGNLKTLWFELSEDDIVKELLSPGPSWQKTFYTLLVAHRENHSADDEDDMDDDIVNEQIVTASAVPAHAMLASSGAAKTLEIARPRRTGEGPGATSAPSSPRLESFDMERRHSTPEKGSAYNTVPVRTTDVTPTKVASPHVRPANPSPRLRPSPLDSPATSLKAPFASPSKLQAPLPAQTARPSGSPRRESDGSYVLPQISLQTASPQRNERPNVDLQRRNTSPTKAAPASAPPSARIALANLYDAPASAHGAAASTSSSSSSSSAAAARSRANRGSGSEMMPPLALPGRASSRPVSPTKATFGAAAAAAPAAPQPAAQPVLQRPSTARAHTTHAAPSIQVPQVGDATMQKFFQEIADELASIRATGEKPDALQSKIEQLKKSMALQQQPAAPAAASSAPSTSGRAAGARGSEMNQFEDAEDDVSEGESMRSVSQASSHQQSYTPSTPMTPLSPAELIAPLSLTDKASARTSIASTVASSNASARNSVRSARSATEASSSGGTSTRRGRRAYSATSARAVLGSVAKRSLLAPPALASIFAPPAGIERASGRRLFVVVARAQEPWTGARHGRGRRWWWDGRHLAAYDARDCSGGHAGAGVWRCCAGQEGQLVRRAVQLEAGHVYTHVDGQLFRDAQRGGASAAELRRARGDGRVVGRAAYDAAVQHERVPRVERRHDGGQAAALPRGAQHPAGGIRGELAGDGRRAGAVAARRCGDWAGADCRRRRSARTRAVAARAA